MDEPADAPPLPPEATPPAAAAPGRHGRAPAALALVLALGALGGWIAGRISAHADPAAGTAIGAAPPAGTGSIAAAERRVAPAVVQIDVETSRRRGRNLFGPPPALAPSPPRYRVESSLGSGVILDPRGYIITNRHVVNRAQRIAVSVAGDTHTYYGRLVGTDNETDLALVKIEVPHPLPVAKLGDSGRLAVGQWVVAIGSPFGLGDSVTAGIVSALNRADPDQQFESFIQTDAPINPGNSGGPLLDLSGEVVGINTAIYTANDGYQGVGFALPSHLVAQVYRQLLQHGRVTRGSIGVYFESALDPAVRRVYHMDAGVPLSQVVENGPAARAGLRAGDLVTSVNGKPIPDGDALMNAVEFLPVGQTLQVGYERTGRAATVAVKVADHAQLYPDPAGTEPIPALPPLPMPPDLGMQLKVLPGGAGLQVESVVPDSFADSIGVRRDDVVLEINHQPVHTRADLNRLANAVPAGADLAMVLRRTNDDGTKSRWLVGGAMPPRTSATTAASPSGKGQ